jgi:hypothetical protein
VDDLGAVASMKGGARMDDKKGLEEVRRWWKRLISSNPEGLEVRPAKPEGSDDWLPRSLGTQMGAPPRDRGKPRSLPKD